MKTIFLFAEKNIMQLVESTFDRYCFDNGECHCDWRIHTYDCEEEFTGLVINYINIAISIVVIVIALVLLYKRVIIKGQRFFDTTGVRGCLRPKPIESMLLCLTMFNTLRLIQSAILISNAVPGNFLALMWFFEIAWPFGYGAFALYLIGMAQTLADSHKAISTGWLPSPRVVDIVGTSIFLGPFLINEPMCLIIGYLVTTNMKVAEILVRIHYFIWSLHCCTLAFTVLYSGTRLCRILTAHLEKFNAGGPRFDAIRTGIIKIRFVMFLISTCLILFAAMGFIYAALRTEMMRSTVGNMAFGGSFMLLGPITTFFVELTVAFNPRSTNIIKVETKSLSSNEEFGSNMYNSAYTSTCVNNDIGTLSRNAFADLKQQQVFYQKQYQGQLQGQENKNSDITTGIKSSTVTTILSGDIELSRTASSSLNGESRNNNIDNINVIPLMAIAQKHKEGNLTIYHQSQQHQQLQLQQSGGSSAKDSIIEEDIVHQEYSSKLSLILNDRH